MKPRIVHLIDDAGAGGVNRMLDYVQTSPTLAEQAVHTKTQIARGSWRVARLEADVIVSHLSVSWRNLPTLVALRARHPGIPLVHVEHSYSEGFILANAVPLRRFHALLRTSYALFDRLVAVSGSQAAWMRRDGLIEPQKLHAIHPVVNLAPFLRLDLPSHQTPLRIGLIGRLHTQKGFDIAIRAFLAANREDLELHVHGDGPERHRLKALAADERSIVFHGFADSPDAAMAGVDIVAMPSRWEPFGLVALEAMAAGRVVIANAVDGLNDQVQGDMSSVRCQHVDAWTQAFHELSRHDLAERSLIARQRAAMATSRFELEWHGLLADVISDRKSTPTPVHAA